MKILLATCVWGGALRTLQAHGHEVVWAGDWSADPGDEEILERARREGRILVTLDKDFGELAVVYGRPHCGIVRLVDLPAANQGPACARALHLHAADLALGAILTVEARRIRVRPGDAADGSADAAE